ncbi:MAG: transcription-repair coupling factor [Candidatus Cloacimonetes bacterium]|nr:transcription-repair coupling factor [Candidatus Cloacimonadota bacterium]
MFYKTVKNYLDNSAKIQEFLHLASSNKPKEIIGLNDSVKSLLLAHLFFANKKSIIYITPNDTIAQNICNDLEIMLEEEQFFHLFGYELLPYEEFSPRPTCRLERSNTLTAAALGRKAVYITSLTELLRKVNPPQNFKKMILSLKIGKVYELDSILDELISTGYSRTSQVTQAGEFSKRGGILDIFSPQYKNPFRIEFFGDEIESIRTFSAETQRSISSDHDSLIIQPVREFALNQLAEEIHPFLTQKIAEKGFYDGIEHDMPLLLDNTSSFLKYFSKEDTLVVCDEAQNYSNIEKNLVEEATEQYEKKLTHAKKEIVPYFTDIFTALKSLSLADYNLFYFNRTENNLADKTLDVKSRSQINFKSNFTLLEDEIGRIQQENYKIFIQSDNKSQSSRIQKTLDFLPAEITYTIGVFHSGFILNSAKLAVFTDHEIFDRYKHKKRFSRFSRAESLGDYTTLENGDYIVHIDYGIGIYHGLQKLEIQNSSMECLVLSYADEDKIYVPTDQLSLVSKFSAEEGVQPTIHRIGGSRWDKTKKKVQEDVEEIAKDLIFLYARRKIAKGYAFSSDTEWQKEMEAAFIYKDTKDQIKATEDVKEDMESSSPMERLICGDVGFGKTEVAVRAAFKAVMDSKQVAFVVPTTILAEQHFLTFSERLKDYPINIEMLSRFVTRTTQKKILNKIKYGEADIIIGTHRLFSKDINFKDLGLLIIDEEQKFGVKHKEKLKSIKENVDTLILTATPIPRTLNMALSGVKDMTVMREAPENRLPIRTKHINFDKKIIKEAIQRELDRQGQIFFLHNRVETIEVMYNRLKDIIPGTNIRIGHAQMPTTKLEKVMFDFYHRKFDILLCTTIIESGIDIPNVNTIIINRADKLGLSQLYQLRGRVGRSDHQAYAYLVTPRKISDTAKDRLRTLEKHEALGSGINIAMRDLEIRGAGNLLGAKQHGVMNTIGISFYNQILKKAISRIKSGEDVDIFAIDKNKTKIQTVIPYYFPKNYIENDKIRLQFYERLNKVEEYKEFAELRDEIKDRFGPIQEPAINVIKYYKIVFWSKKLAIDNISIDKNRIIISFGQDISQKKISTLLEKIPNEISFKQSKGFQLTVKTPIREYKNNFDLCSKILRLLV